ncbi:hypothetical protein EBR43_05655 [bacterium]|nr:hypothetical protein [bacterium]
MQKIKMFVLDFVGYFVILAGAALIAAIELMVQMKFMLEKCICQTIIPAALEMTACIHWLLALLWQSMLSVTSDAALHCSKWLLQVSKACHIKSEQLIDKTWSVE